MRILKSGLMAAGALALAAMLLNFVAPKSVHAAVAALVQVVNTSANPVPNQDVDAPARNAIVIACTGTNSCSTEAIPAHMTFVLDSVSVIADGAIPVVGLIAITKGVGSYSYLTAQYVPTLGTYGTSTVATNLTVYCDGGQPLVLFEYGAADTSLRGSFSGHLVSTP
jgi:hypothetical protein